MNLVRTRHTINSQGAETVLQAAAGWAESKGLRVVIAVVDAYGELITLRRLEGTQIVSASVATDKARTAAIFVRPSRELEAQVSAGRIGALTLRGAVALTGGIPLVFDGEVVGAIGTSGETPDEDEAVSLAGAEAEFTVQAIQALTFEGAQLVADAAATVARGRGVHPVVAVVDAGGQLMYQWRPDSAQVASVNVALDKARTAALFRRPSKDFEDQVSKGRVSAMALDRSVPLQGGIPIVHDGQVIGAVGVSGASSADEDNELAVLAAADLADRAADHRSSSNNHQQDAHATFVAARTVTDTFASGGLLVDAPGYKVDAGRRRAPGEVEYHDRVTDVMYVQTGTATVVSGGRMVDARDVAPGERRARSIDGGATQTLQPGDVLVVPAGVPHQFTKVSDPFLYYVVKVVQ